MDRLHTHVFMCLGMNYFGLSFCLIFVAECIEFADVSENPSFLIFTSKMHPTSTKFHHLERMNCFPFYYDTPDCKKAMCKY